MRIAAHILMALNILRWGDLVWLGVVLTNDTSEQTMPTIPATIFYEVVPACVLALALSRTFVEFDKKGTKTSALCAPSGACMAFLPIYLPEPHDNLLGWKPQ